MFLTVDAGFHFNIRLIHFRNVSRRVQAEDSGVYGFHAKDAAADTAIAASDATGGAAATRNYSHALAAADVCGSSH